MELDPFFGVRLDGPHHHFTLVDRPLEKRRERHPVIQRVRFFADQMNFAVGILFFELLRCGGPCDAVADDHVALLRRCHASSDSPLPLSSPGRFARRIAALPCIWGGWARQPGGAPPRPVPCGTPRREAIRLMHGPPRLASHCRPAGRACAHSPLASSRPTFSGLTTTTGRSHPAISTVCPSAARRRRSTRASVASPGASPWARAA